MSSIVAQKCSSVQLVYDFSFLPLDTRGASIVVDDVITSELEAGGEELRTCEADSNGEGPSDRTDDPVAGDEP